MANKHLEYGGSTAERTYYCPGWHVFRRLLPTPPSTPEANIGTALHMCMDDIVCDRRTIPELLGMTVEGVEITPELMIDKLVPAMEAFRELCDMFDIDEYESEVPVRWGDDVGGTGDIIALSRDKKTAIFVDWKFGDGVMVSPEDNAQEMHYANSAINTVGWIEDLEKVERIVLVIIQPTSRDDQDTLKFWETTPEYVRQFGDDYMDSVKIARGLVAVWETDKSLPGEEFLQVGDHCRFCPAVAICPLKTGLFEKAKRLMPSIAEDLGTALTLCGEMELYIKATRALAHEQMDRGDAIPGWKLVAKRAVRVWRDPDILESLVKGMRSLKKDETHTSVLLTPARMQALCKSKDIDFKKFADYIHSVSSGTTIAVESDSRPTAPGIAALKALAARVG